MAASRPASSDTTLRLVIADDHALVRQGLRGVIDKQGDMEVIGEAADGRTAVHLVAELRPGILVTDLSMPDMDGVEVTRAVRVESADAQVIGITRHRETQFLRAMLDAGAAGYVLKQSPSNELVQAIRSVAAGTMYIDPAFAQVNEPIRSRDNAHLAPAPSGNISPALSVAEWAVLDLVAAAHSDANIADRLSMRTVDVRAVRTAAMQKAGLQSRAQVVEFVRSKQRQSGQ